MALPAAWSDHTAVVEFLLEKGAAVASAEVRPRCILQHGTAAWSAPMAHSTRPFHAASAEVRPRCILQLRSSLAHSTLPFHAAVPRCRSTLPFHAAECSGREGLGEHLCI